MNTGERSGAMVRYLRFIGVHLWLLFRGLQ
jgi:hypothetical protein